MSIAISYGSFAFSGLGNDPLVSFDTQINRSEAGYIIGTTDKIRLNGIIFGSGRLNDAKNANDPVTSNAWTTLASGIGFLSTGLKDYSSLTIKCGSTEIYKSNPLSTIIESVNINNSTDDNWNQIVDYTINLSVANSGHSNYIPDTGFYISDFSDNYSMQIAQDNHYYYHPVSTTTPHYPNSVQTQRLPVYNITRDVSAVGIYTSGSANSALNNAKNFVSGILNTNPQINNIINNLTLLNRSIVISASEIDGQYSIKDSFIAMSGLGASGWIDTFTINNEVNDQLLRTVSIQGTVKGLNDLTVSPVMYNNVLNNQYMSNFSGTQFKNASGGYYVHVKPNIFSRILSTIFPTGSLSGLANQYSLNTGLNPIPISANVDHNIVEGSIGYSYTYNSRPLCLVTGAITESLNFEDSFSTRTYNMQDVYYRMPLPQDIGTRSIPSRTVTYEATFIKPLKGAAIPPSTKSQITGIIEQFNPNKLTPISSSAQFGPGYFSWVTANEESYDIMNGKYSIKYAWQYQKAYFPQGFY
jgi:hypothetical protein